MKECIREIKNYILNNPFVQKESLKNKIMRNLFLLYKKCRITVSKWWPLDDWQKNSWDEDYFAFDSPSNAASVYIDGNSKQPYFYIEHCHIMELIPKEQMNDVINGIIKFCAKHSKNSFFHTYGRNVEYFKKFYEGYALSHLGDFSIREDSKLRKYISQIHFRVVNLSSSFCCLNIVIFLNKQLKNDLSAYAVSHVPEQQKISGFENKKWYHFRDLSYGTFSGSIHKYETIEKVITDIKWNTMKELNKYITPMVFHSQTINVPSACSISTNIDGNNNKEFWRSIDIDPRFCDFYNDMSACIAWRSKDNSPFCLYSNEKKSDDISTKNSIFSYHIGDELCSYLIASCVDKSIRSKLAKYSCAISKLKKRVLNIGSNQK